MGWELQLQINVSLVNNCPFFPLLDRWAEQRKGLIFGYSSTGEDKTTNWRFCSILFFGKAYPSNSGFLFYLLVGSEAFEISTTFKWHILHDKGSKAVEIFCNNMYVVVYIGYGTIVCNC
jgi:hypothetical protein